MPIDDRSSLLRFELQELINTWYINGGLQVIFIHPDCSFNVAPFQRRTKTQRSILVAILYCRHLVASSSGPCLFFDAYGLSCRSFPSASIIQSNHTKMITESIRQLAVIRTRIRLVLGAVEKRPSCWWQLRKRTWAKENYKMAPYQNPTWQYTARIQRQSAERAKWWYMSCDLTVQGPTNNSLFLHPLYSPHVWPFR